MNPIPKDWCMAKIQELTTRTKQCDPSRQPGVYFRYVDVSSVSNTLFKIISATEILRSDSPSRARKEIKTNDILFATVRPTLKRIAIVPIELDGQIASTGYCVLRPQTDKVDPKFLYYSLLTRSFIKAMEAVERGASYPAIRDSDVFSALIPLPPLPEQRRITHILSTVQTAIEQQERLIALTRELKSAVMHKLFSEGLRGEKQKQTEIGLIPESWTYTTLGDLASKPDGLIQTGPFGSQLHKDEYTTEGIPVVNPTNLLGNRINPENISRISSETAKPLKRHILKKGDILFGRRGEIGRHGLVTEKEDGWFCGTGSFMVRVRKPIIDNRFLNLYFSTSTIVNWLNSNAAGAIMPNLSTAVLKRMPVFYSSIEEQKEIADCIETIEEKLQLITEKKDLLEELFRTLLHQLMTGQIRVNEISF
jgi:type I restriction enzyme S subunit